MYRPFPADAVRRALSGVSRVIVLERAFAPGAGGIVSADVRAAVAGTETRISTVVAGLGGRAISKKSLRQLLIRDDLDELTFLDLRHDLVDRELARMDAREAAGPHTLDVLRDAGIPASRIG